MQYAQGLGAPRQARWPNFEDDVRRRFLMWDGDNKLFGMRDELTKGLCVVRKRY